MLFSSAVEDDLEKFCYIATGFKQLLIGPDGGTYTLGSGDASLEVPPGTVEKETLVRYAIILHGPFVVPAGCKLASVIIYLNMDGATLRKPVVLYLSHWCSWKEGDGEESLKFLRASHTLEVGQHKYVFEELEERDFTTRTDGGILSISQPQCLYCVEVKKHVKIARYNAITFAKGITSGEFVFRIQIMCDSWEWNKVTRNSCI